ncbi:MAG: DUF1186 domain-containing protein [Promethearchaeota archaeon]|nr:MAG: DUF1186 domain-containing protein [Candidatus Lokiarchaeota archaeon]
MKYNTGTFPRKAVQAAIKKEGEIIPFTIMTEIIN